MTKKLEEYNKNVQDFVEELDFKMSKLGNTFTVEYDASIKDVVEVMENIISGNLDWPDDLYARKVVMKHHIVDAYITGIVFAKSLQDFENDIIGNYYYPLDSFPTIVRLRDKKEVYVQDGDKLITYDEWKELNNMNLKPNDYVVTAFNETSFNDTNIIETSIYLGQTKEGPNGTMSLLSDLNEKNVFYAFEGPYTPFITYRDNYNVGKTFFISFEEYKLILKCNLEKAKKVRLLVPVDHYSKTYVPKK